MRVLVTGVTGFLGSHLVPELLKDGHEVIGLVHRKSVSGPPIQTITGDVADIRSFYLRVEMHNVDAIVHCAGQVSFLPRDRDRLMKVNVWGTKRMEELATFHKAHLFHISTAYVCGNSRGLFSPYVRGRDSRNIYEDSKQRAEVVIFPTLAGRAPCTIIRPSILVGDSRVYGIPPLMGIYAGVKACYIAKAWVEKKAGLPQLAPVLRIHGDPEATINLIPVDLAARQIADLVRQTAVGAYHVVNRHPPLVGDVVTAAGKAIDAQLEVCMRFRANPAERMLDKMLKPLLPYLQGEPVFDTSNWAGLKYSPCDGLPPGFIEATTRAFLLGTGATHDRPAERSGIQDAIRPDLERPDQARPNVHVPPQ